MPQSQILDNALRQLRESAAYRELRVKKGLVTRLPIPAAAMVFGELAREAEAAAAGAARPRKRRLRLARGGPALPAARSRTAADAVGLFLGAVAPALPGGRHLAGGARRRGPGARPHGARRHLLPAHHPARPLPPAAAARALRRRPARAARRATTWRSRTCSSICRTGATTAPTWFSRSARWPCAAGSSTSSRRASRSRCGSTSSATPSNRSVISSPRASARPKAPARCRSCRFRFSRKGRAGPESWPTPCTSITAWAPRPRSPTRSLPCATGATRSAAFSTAGRTTCRCCIDGTVSLADLLPEHPLVLTVDHAGALRRAGPPRRAHASPTSRCRAEQGRLAAPPEALEIPARTRCAT